MSDNFFSSISSSFNEAKDGVSQAIRTAEGNKTTSSILDVLDPSKSRLTMARLLSGGRNAGPKNTTPDIRFTDNTQDWRVKVSLAKSADYFYRSIDPGIMAPLQGTNGVIFPYTPQVSVTHLARYGQQPLTHSNYTNYTYDGSEVQAIQINGDFTVQNVFEGRYLLASIYFFRAATKMFFGSGSHVGNPPPMVFLSGYGSHYFPNVPCVVTQFNHNLPQDVDYLNVPVDAGTVFGTQNQGANSMSGSSFTRVPTSSQISITLQPIYTRKDVYDNFSLEQFAAGKLINKGFI